MISRAGKRLASAKHFLPICPTRVGDRALVLTFDRDTNRGLWETAHVTFSRNVADRVGKVRKPATVEKLTSWVKLET